MTTRVIIICDGCGRDIMEPGRFWEVISPMSATPAHFHDVRCLADFAQRELTKKVVPLRPADQWTRQPGGISHAQTPFQHEEPKK